MELTFWNPLMPNVDGIRYETAFRNHGIFDAGHDMPEMNRNGSEVNTKNGITTSLSLIITDAVMAKNMQDKIYGMERQNSAEAFVNCVKLNKYGTTISSHVPIMAYIVRNAIVRPQRVCPTEYFRLKIFFRS